MLKRVDRVQIAVRDTAAAARAIGAVLGAEVVRQDEVAALGARRTAVQAGTSIIEPAGAWQAAGRSAIFSNDGAAGSLPWLLG